MKAVIRINHQIFGRLGFREECRSIMFKDSRDLFRNIMPKSRGSDAQMVYIIIYMDAWSRSGW